ncbi:MAG: hypothetical protein Kow0025_13960 [Thermodesulfovibrionales bacterium]
MDRREKVKAPGRKAATAAALCLALAAAVLFSAALASAQGLMILAKKVAGDLPSEASAPAWGEAEAVEVPLAAQVMAIPRQYEPSVEKLDVRALHNSKEIAFLVRWRDATRDSLVDLDSFSDALALEFPSSGDASGPHFAMGDEENAVNIWYWKAAWQEEAGKGREPSNEEGYSPRFFTDERGLFLDDFQPGALAGNPVSAPGRPPVETLVARGFGSATDMDKSDGRGVEGGGIWQSGGWAVVMKRAMAAGDKYDAAFSEGGVTPVSFAVWNGADGQRGGVKAVSTWYYVGLETEEKMTTYIYPMLAFAGAVGLELAIIMWIRKRRA